MVFSDMIIFDLFISICSILIGWQHYLGRFLFYSLITMEIFKDVSFEKNVEYEYSRCIGFYVFDSPPPPQRISLIIYHIT